MSLAPRPASPGTNVPSRNRSAPLELCFHCTGFNRPTDADPTIPCRLSAAGPSGRAMAQRRRSRTTRRASAKCRPRRPWSDGLVRGNGYERDVPDRGGRAAARRSRGDRVSGFEEFYAAELPRLVALARGLCPAHLAEDVAQEAMLVAYRRWREVAELERPDLWVRRTCANLAVSQFRRRMVEVRATARLAGRRQPPVELSETGEEFWAAVRAPAPAPGPGGGAALRLRHAGGRDRRDARHQRRHGQAAPQPGPPRPGVRARRTTQED